MTVILTAEARSRLDAHLDAVEKALENSGKTRQERRGVVDDLEAQIMEMLATRSAAPELPDIEAVLAQLDPPTAYAADAGKTKVVVAPPLVPMRPRYSRTAIWGFVCIIASLFLLVLLLPLGYLFFARMSVHQSARSRAPVHVIEEVKSQPAEAQNENGSPRLATPVTQQSIAAESQPAHAEIHTSWNAGPFVCLFVLIGPLGLLGTILGWIAFGQIRTSKGALRGKGLALFDGLFYPVLAVLFLFLALLAVA